MLSGRTDPSEAEALPIKWVNRLIDWARAHERIDRLYVFGSRARGDNRPDSDIDIMVEFDPTAHVTVFNYAGLKDYIAGLFDGPVDVVSREGLKPYVRPAATTDAIYAF